MTPTLVETTDTAVGRMVPLSVLRPSPLNPRKKFDDATMADLQANIAAHGVLVPLLVRPSVACLEVIDGERRYRAAQAVGLAELPVIELNDLTDGEVIDIVREGKSRATRYLVAK